ncbi:MAG: AAA family ATPase [candidate division Zixibacteria bacterium]|nr:AAA family ATPase [candidate division Zixibacteria bacterium]
MQIEKCQIYRYGKLDRFSSSFSPGLNLIKGPNEAGKSTLVDALTDALFENPKTRKKDVKAKTSWGFEKDFEITLDFESEGLSYSLSKDFDTGSVTLLKKSTGETLDDRKRVNSIVSNGLGLSNRDIFLATSCIRQDEMARIANSPDAIKDRLEALITGGKEEALASKAIDRLAAQIKGLKKTGIKHKGQLQALEDRRTELAYDLEKAKREIGDVKQSRTRLKNVKTTLESLREEYEVKTTQRKNSKLAIDIRETSARLEERFSDLMSRTSNIKVSEETVEKVRNKIAHLPKIDKADVRHADEQAAQRKYLDTKREGCEQQVSDLTEKINLAKPGTALKLMSALTLAGTGALAYYWYRFTAMADASFLFGAGASLVLFIIFSILWSKRSKSCTQVKVKFDLQKSRLEEIEEDLSENKVAIEAVLGKYKFDKVELLKEKFEQRYELDKDIRSEVNRYEGYLGEKTLKELEDELKIVTRDLAIENERFREVKSYTMSAEDFAILETAVDKIKKETGELESEEMTLERQLDFAESGIEHQASLEERIEEIDTQVARKRHQLRVLETTQQYIETARKDVLKSTLQLLDDETSDILREVTDGKYSQVRFDRQSLKFEVYSNELDDWVDPESHLSRGTIDQLYLAARLALVRIISEEKNPVIILDDPFVTFDDNRRRNALKVLKRFAERYQIFLLTCHDHYDGITDNVINLT